MLRDKSQAHPAVGTWGAASLLLATLAFLGSCTSTASPGIGRSVVDQRLTQLEARNQHLETRLRLLEEESREAWSAALCSVADRDFFAAVRAELADQTKPKGCSTEVALSCSAQQISPAIHGRGGLGALFKSLHSRAAFYLPKDATSLPEYRLERLKKLGHLPLLPTTFFVFFAYPVASEPQGELEARQRTEMINKYLVDHLRSGITARLKTNGSNDAKQLDKGVREYLKDRIWNLRLDTVLKKKDLDLLDLPIKKSGSLMISGAASGCSVSIASWTLGSALALALGGSVPVSELQLEVELLHHSASLQGLRAFDPAQNQWLTAESPDAPLRIVHLWALECRICKTELPTVLRMVQAYQRPSKSKSVQFILVAESDERDLRTYFNEHAADFGKTTLFKADGRLRQTLATSVQPITLLLDRKGTIVHAFVGSLLHRRSEFVLTVERVLATLPQDP